MPLDECFVGAGGRLAWLGGKPRTGFTTVAQGFSPAFAALNGCATGHGYVAVMIPVDAPHRLGRLVRWLATPWRVAAAERRLMKGGATCIARYGVWPDAEQPAFVYPLESAASAYADAELLPVPTRALEWLRRAAGPLRLCHPSLAAVVVIGRAA